MEKNSEDVDDFVVKESEFYGDHDENGMLVLPAECEEWWVY